MAMQVQYHCLGCGRTMKREIARPPAYLWSFCERTNKKQRMRLLKPSSPNSRSAPPGDKRLTVNMRADLHMRLKMAAVKRRTTVGEIVEELTNRLDSHA